MSSCTQMAWWWLRCAACAKQRLTAVPTVLAETCHGALGLGMLGLGHLPSLLYLQNRSQLSVDALGSSQGTLHTWMSSTAVPQPAGHAVNYIAFSPAPSHVRCAGFLGS